MRSRCAALVGLVWVAACTPGADRVTVGRVLVDLPAALDARPADRDALRLSAGAALRRDDSVRFRPGEDGATHVVRLELDSSAPPSWTVVVTLQSLGEAPSFSASASGEASVEVVPAVMGLYARAWDLVRRERVLAKASNAALLAALSSEYEPQLRAYVVERLGEGHAHEAAEPLIALLGSEKHTEVQLRAVGALVALDDRRAVPAIIALAERRPPDFVVPLLYALARLGGTTAEGYLVTVASGHPSVVVRAAAEEALGEMRDRRQVSVPSRTRRE